MLNLRNIPVIRCDDEDDVMRACEAVMLRAWSVPDFNPHLLFPYEPKRKTMQTVTLGVRASIADDLSLYPGERKVLAHLRAGKTLTPHEAVMVYGNQSLHRSISRLRAAGYKITTRNCRDETGHRYARYSLAG